MSKEYIEKVVFTESKDFEAIKQRISHVNIRLLHGAIGIATEGGEVLDAIKKHVYYGKELDLNNIKEELGDLAWYMAIICDVLGVTLEEIQDANIKKLQDRYPNGFTKEDAINRDTKNEMEKAGLTG